MVISEGDRLRYENIVKRNFGFLEDIGQMEFGGVRIIDRSSPRDRGLAVRYSRKDLRVDVGWKEDEKSLTVIIKFESQNLPRQEQCVYFEPFIEFLSGGEIGAIVPYVREGMTIKELEVIMKEREYLFKETLDEIMAAVGDKMKTFFNEIQSASLDAVHDYHVWMKKRSR